LSSQLKKFQAEKNNWFKLRSSTGNFRGRILYYLIDNEDDAFTWTESFSSGLAPEGNLTTGKA
jgi:hypothetical protein